MSHKLPICSDAAEKAIKNDDTKDTEYHPNFLILRTHRVPQLSTCCNFNDDDDDEEESPQSGSAVGLAPQN